MVDPAESGGSGQRKMGRTPDAPVVVDVALPVGVQTTHTDAFAEERKARYAAACRLKQEKEAEKARIRQQLQDDKATRRSRHNFLTNSEPEQLKSTLTGTAHAGHIVGSIDKTPSASQLKAVVELQIRCPGLLLIKASFTAGTTLKEVRTYVESQLQQPAVVENGDVGIIPGRLPFSGASSRLSSNRQAEREILQAARDNFEAQTSRILASAMELREIPPSQSKSTIYFLIPFPRREFFSESSLDLTLSDAQLAPRGTLVVQFCSNDTPSVSGQGKTELASQHRNVEATSGRGNNDARYNATVVGLIDGNIDEVGKAQSDHPRLHPSGDAVVPVDKSLKSNSLDKSGRILEIEGEGVRLRELALQAAARRMTEAAKMFREGLPPQDGEARGGFYFPSGSDSLHTAQKPGCSSSRMGKGPSSPKGKVESTDEATRLVPNFAGADANISVDASRADQLPLPRDALRLHAMAAAEARMLCSQSHQPLVIGSTTGHVSKEEISRLGVDKSATHPRSRARVPSSSRLLMRPEKLQRTVDNNGLPELHSNAKGKGVAEGSVRHLQITQDATGQAEEIDDVTNKGKGLVAEPSSSHQTESMGPSSLRIRLEDGTVVMRSFPASTILQHVRDSVVPDGADESAFGLVVTFPEPHFIDGPDLSATLAEVGLVPRGTVHLTKAATRGMVRQGRRAPLRPFEPFYEQPFVDESDEEVEDLDEIFQHLTEQMQNRPDLTYEELMELEESISRVNVGVPEPLIAALPTHLVRSKTREDGATGELVSGDDELDLCVVCMSEMAEGEEALSLPCLHTFHNDCIRQWLRQSTSCPTCKHSLS